MSDYKNLIASIREIAGVAGIAVANAEGQLLQSDIAAPAPDLAGITQGVYSNIAVQIKRMQRGRVQQLALETEDGITLLSGLSQGELLIVYANVVEGFNVAHLMEVASRF